jgi:hypothetical protein
MTSARDADGAWGVPPAAAADPATEADRLGVPAFASLRTRFVSQAADSPPVGPTNAGVTRLSAAAGARALQRTRGRARTPAGFPCHRTAVSRVAESASLNPRGRHRRPALARGELQLLRRRGEIDFQTCVRCALQEGRKGRGGGSGGTGEGARRLMSGCPG